MKIALIHEIFQSLVDCFMLMVTSHVRCWHTNI